MTTGQELVDLAMTQRGKRYIFGFEVQPGFNNFVNAAAWDCSELVERTCGLKGVYIPDGSNNQRQFCKSITVDKGLATPGALLFIGGNATHHVAFSRGDGSTIEAKGSKWGVIVQENNKGRFDRAGLIPGVTYPGQVTGATMTPPPGSLAAVAQGLFYSRQLVLGPGRENPLAAMAYLRAGINRLTGRNLPPTGPWDDAVQQAVIDINRISGQPSLLEFCGAHTWGVMYPTP